MGYFEEKMQEFMTIYREIAEMYIRDLQEAPPGSLTTQVTHGRRQLLHCYREDGRRIRHTITQDQDMLRSLARKEFARQALKIVEHNAAVLEELSEKLIPFDADGILKAMSGAYASLPEDFFFDREKLSIAHHLDGEATARIKRHEAWGRMPYKQTDHYAERRRIKTSRGLKVRSKSEALIAETLFRYGIPFHYDEEMHFGDFVTAPDFVFEDAGSNLILWEHMGMMERKDYARRNFWKMSNYHAHGIIPGDRLILSFDSDGMINMELIDAIVRHEVIPRL